MRNLGNAAPLHSPVSPARKAPPVRRVSRIPRLAAVAASAIVAVGTSITVPAAHATSTVTDGCNAPVDICFTVFRPAGATAETPVPIVMSSHGWGGSRTTDPAAFAYLLDAGLGVLSFDQRGFGASGGQARIENPDVEGKDVQKVIDHIASLDWVKKTTPNDPVLGAVGGSYGGGYQFVGAFSELRGRGTTRFDALVPEITWNSLTESLFPQGVPRTEWVTALTAAAVPSEALPPAVYQGLVEAAATGVVPTSLYDFLAKNGPAWHVAQGRKLDIPVLFGQGGTDNLFPLSEGLKNFSSALTDKARARSIFVSHNGGHTLPAVFPQGTNDRPAADACSPTLGSPTFADLGLRFLQQTLQGRKTGLTGNGASHLTTAGERSLDARIVQNNMLPIREVGTVFDKKRADLELPSVAVDVPAGQTLFLTVSPISDMSAGFGSRIFGAMVLRDVTVNLPLVP